MAARLAELRTSCSFNRASVSAMLYSTKPQPCLRLDHFLDKVKRETACRCFTAQFRNCEVQYVQLRSTLDQCA